MYRDCKIVKHLCSFIEAAILNTRIFLKAQAYDLASDELPSKINKI